jgi:hypothetical protein
MSTEEKKDVYERLTDIERKIDMIIAMIEMQKREVNKEQYLEFIEMVQQNKHVPEYPLMNLHDDDNDITI